MTDMDYICKEWFSPTRYYRLEISKDMFGMWVIIRTWCSRTSAKGSSLVISTAEKAEALAWDAKVSRERTKKGYTLLPA